MSINTRQAYLAVVGLCSLVLFILILHVPLLSADALIVHYLDVGQGDATLVQLPDSTTVLIDGGPDNAVLHELGRLLPWWQRTIDYLIITHPHLDHYNGFFGVVEKYRIGRVFFNGEEGTSHFSQLMSEMHRREIPLTVVSAGDTFTLPDGVTLEFLWPKPSYPQKSVDALSLAFLISRHDSDFLFMGDVPQDEELEILRVRPTLQAEVVKVGHHGSSSSSHASFLQAVAPEHCIISAGRNNRYGHPHRQTLRNLGRALCRVWVTFEHGTVSATTRGARLLLTAELVK